MSEHVTITDAEGHRLTITADADGAIVVGVNASQPVVVAPDVLLRAVRYVMGCDVLPFRGGHDGDA